MEIENIKSEIADYLSSAKLDKVFNLLKEHCIELKIDREEVDRIQGIHQNNEKQSHQNLITREVYDLNYSKTLKSIQLILDGDQSLQKSEDLNVSSFRKRKIIYYMLGCLIVALGSILITKSNIFSPQEGLSNDIDLQTSLLTIANPHIEISKKDELIKEIKKLYDKQTIVSIKGKEGTLLEKFELERFLKRLKLAEFKNFIVDQDSKDSIVIKLK